MANYTMDSKQAMAAIIDPLHAPEPADETGLGAHFGSTFAPANKVENGPISPPGAPLSSKNPYRQGSNSRSPPTKTGVSSSERSIGQSSPPQKFPSYREQAFGDYNPERQRGRSSTNPPPAYDDGTADREEASGHRRRTSSLRERFPGDNSHRPLDIIRRDSKKADRSPHLKKRHLPGADSIDQLDPAIGGRAYHHEGPYDAALLARNNTYKNSPLEALRTSNREALKATPPENIKDAIERHRPLDGVATIPPGFRDRFGRSYNYEEGADLMHETNEEGPGYKRWSGQDYSPDDLTGKGEPSFSLDRALRAHKIDGDGIEMQDRADLNKAHDEARRNGTLDSRDPPAIAGDGRRYADMETAISNDTDAKLQNGGSLKGTLKKRMGSLRRKKQEDD